MLDYLMLGTNKMVNYVGSRRMASSITKPFLTNITHDDASWIVNAAVLASMLWQFLMKIKYKRSQAC